MLHVPDVEMPADCLTKWLPSTKIRRSVEYMTGVRAQPTDASHAVIEIEGLEEAISHLSDATYLHEQPENQVGGSVVGKGVQGPGEPLRNS